MTCVLKIVTGHYGLEYSISLLSQQAWCQPAYVSTAIHILCMLVNSRVLFKMQIIHGFQQSSHQPVGIKHFLKCLILFPCQIQFFFHASYFWSLAISLFCLLWELWGHGSWWATYSPVPKLTTEKNNASRWVVLGVTANVSWPLNWPKL